MNSLTFGSLFSGIGGFDLGFEKAGFQCRWQVEIDDYATHILEKHWPQVHRYRDVRECNASNLEQVDCIIGGFPCQDISYAGRGAGLDGERSGLFFEAVRVVRQLQPRAIVLENVAALLTRGLDRVLGTLAEIGYDAQWHCIPAAAVGAPHIRDRVFVLGYANGGRGQAWESTGQTARHGLSASSTSVDASSMADAQGFYGQGFYDGSRKVEFGRSSWWELEPGMGRVAHGIPSRVDRLKCLGNAIVPQVAEVVANIAKTQLLTEHRPTAVS